MNSVGLFIEDIKLLMSACVDALYCFDPFNNALVPSLTFDTLDIYV